MTIFATFYVPEGIVITSDSRITLKKTNEDGSVEKEILSDSEQKIFLLRNEDVGMVYTAEDMPDGFIMKDFIKNMNKFIIKPKDSIIDITHKITFFLERDVKGIKISMVIAGYDNKEPYVYLITNEADLMTIKLLNRDHNNRILYRATMGGNLKRINQIFDYTKSYNDVSLEEALKYGCYLVSDSIEYLNNLDEYSDVGGEIKFLTIRSNGRINYNLKK
jgi:hypothetical protein